jgi:hypothetical protein
MEWIVLFAAILLGVPAAAWFAQERLVFFPQPVVLTTNLPADAKPLEIVATDGTRLRGWMRGASAMSAPVVLYFGGNAEEVSGTLVDPRWRVTGRSSPLTIGAMGRAGTPGESASPARWSFTTRLLPDLMSTHGESSRRCSLDRRGGEAGGRTASRQPDPRLAVRQPGRAGPHPLSMDARIDATSAPVEPISMHGGYRFHCAAIVADRDSIIPHERSQALYDAWAGPKSWLVVRATDHNTLSVPDAFWAGIAGFLGART